MTIQTMVLLRIVALLRTSIHCGPGPRIRRPVRLHQTLGRRTDRALANNLHVHIGIAAACWYVHYIAPRDRAMRQCHEISRPGRRFRRRVIGTQQLSAAGKSPFAPRGVVGASFSDIGVCPGAHQVPLTHQVRNDILRAIILFDEGAVILPGLRVCEDQPAAQCRRPLQINRAHALLVHQKYNFARACAIVGQPSCSTAPSSVS